MKIQTLSIWNEVKDIYSVMGVVLCKIFLFVESFLTREVGITVAEQWDLFN